MKEKLIAKEKECFYDLLELAYHSMQLDKTKYAKKLLEDAIKSINEMERLKDSETVILIGSIVHSRGANDI